MFQEQVEASDDVRSKTSAGCQTTADKTVVQLKHSVLSAVLSAVSSSLDRSHVSQHFSDAFIQRNSLNIHMVLSQGEKHQAACRKSFRLNRSVGNHGDGTSQEKGS